ncbi:tellurite-like stress resistance cysteine protease StiP [Arenicella sp.]|nr:tellurite-like stress resistance cysteine protease StiP [Arenicella sp.]
MNKLFLNADQLQRDSFALAQAIVESGYRPTFLIGLWRGGTPIAITVQEVLEFCGIETNHISVRVSSYKGIDQRTAQINIHGLSYIKDNVTPNDKILIVDDVHDTGLSMAKLIKQINQLAKPQQIKIAVAYFKPEKSRVGLIPDFFVHKTNDWLVFPHELVGLSDDEIAEQKPAVEELKTWLINKGRVET